MNAKAEERIATMRATIAAERKAVADLASKADALKPQLSDVTSMLDLVEHGCLDPKVLAHPPRNDSQWKYLLDSAAALLAPAVARREYVADLFAKFGPDIKIFPS
jgi:hypothetical protein